MKIWFKLFVILILSVLFGTGRAKGTHLLGGYMQYRFVQSYADSETYEILLYVYRDCRMDSNTYVGVPLDREMNLCIFSSDKVLKKSVSMPLQKKEKTMAAGLNGCNTAMPYCIEIGVYAKQITLRKLSGYYFKAERCCRSNTSNLATNNGINYQGVTWHCYIEWNGVKNSSPVMNGSPLGILCFADTVSWNLDITDPDGDSLSYENADLLQGAGLSDPLPECAGKYALSPIVDYLPDHSKGTLMGKGSASTVNEANGDLTLYSESFGFFPGSLKIHEWRDGIKRNSVQFEFVVIIGNIAQTLERRINAIKVYPNPVNQQLYIEGVSSAIVPWEIMDMSGRVVQQGDQLQTTGLDVSGISTGSYLLVLKGELRKTVKFIICQ